MGKSKSLTAQRSDLSAKVAELKARRDEAERQLNAAQSEFLRIEREIKRNQQPTPAMLELLGRLVDGGKIHRNRYQSSSYYFEDREGHTSHIRSSLFYGLREREIIDETAQGDKTYHVTAHGRAVYSRWNEAT